MVRNAEPNKDTTGRRILASLSSDLSICFFGPALLEAHLKEGSKRVERDTITNTLMGHFFT
jgi:hypothetical protein